MRAILIVVTLGVSAAAHAQAMDVYMDAKDTKPASLEVMVVGAPKLPLDKIASRASPNDPPIHPVALRSFADGPDRLAIAIVIDGQELFIGNDDYEDDENSRYPGVLAQLEAELDKMQLATRAPAGSTISVVEYGNGARIRVPTEPLTAFSAAQLGTQHDYYRQIGNDMVAGVELGMHQLDASDAPVKLLFVIGDGNDTNDEAAKSQLRELKKRAAQSHVIVNAVTYKTAISAEGEVVTMLAPGAHTVNSVEGLASSIDDQLDRATSRYYLTFIDDRLPWDGRGHDLTLAFGHDEADPVWVTLPGHRGGSVWWRGVFAQIGLGLGLVALWVLGMRLRSSRELSSLRTRI
jgi:hypothetical protein